MATLVSIVALLSGVALGLDNGVARTPPMGWNPYLVYSCDTDEAQYRAAAAALVQSGLKDLGYQYFNMDCGWQATERSQSGTLAWNAAQIPSGIPALASYVHGLGLQFGIYSDAGYYSCDPIGGNAQWIGSLGYEQSDADTIAGWGVDYLKYDNCFAVAGDFVDFDPSIQLEPHYTAMRDALANTGRKIVYSISEWGIQDPASWAVSVANSWRIANDDGPPASFANLQRIINEFVPIAHVSQPGAWNDLDLLAVGSTGLTQTEWAMHFAFWSAAKSPLLISTDLTAASKEVLDILGNKAIIAINRDPLGQSITFKRRYTDSYDVWAGPLKDGSMVVVILNWMNDQQSVVLNLMDVGVVSADMTDLWTGIDLGTATTTYTASVDAHGALIYKLANFVQAPVCNYTTYFATAPSNILAGGAVERALSTTSVVGYIGNGGTLTFSGVDGGGSGGRKTLLLSYVNAEISNDNTECPNCRRAQVSVNGGNPVEVEMPISGQTWDDVSEGYLLDLTGFVAGSSNTITFANPNMWAPDMYSIAIQDCEGTL